MSQHLALLRKDGLVTARRDGQTIWYSIGSPQARELVRTLYQVYCAPTSACASECAAQDGAAGAAEPCVKSMTARGWRHTLRDECEKAEVTSSCVPDFS